MGDQLSEWENPSWSVEAQIQILKCAGVDSDGDHFLDRKSATVILCSCDKAFLLTKGPNYGSEEAFSIASLSSVSRSILQHSLQHIISRSCQQTWTEVLTMQNQPAELSFHTQSLLACRRNTIYLKNLAGLIQMQPFCNMPDWDGTNRTTNTKWGNNSTTSKEEPYKNADW
jgi:hypothetical protein